MFLTGKFCYLEQLVLKHNATAQAIIIKQMDQGIDMFFSRRRHAEKFVEFIGKVVPSRSRNDKQLVSHDPKSNNYNYKYTFSVEISPVCREDLICLPPKASNSLGNLGPLVICTKEYQPLEMAYITDGDDSPSVRLEELLADLDLSEEEAENDSMSTRHQFCFGVIRSACRRDKLKGLDLQAGLRTLKQIKVAIKNFGPDNKVGEGDFGSVYKGTKSDREMESAQAKNQALRDAGAVVPNSYESFEGTIKEAFENLKSSFTYFVIALLTAVIYVHALQTVNCCIISHLCVDNL
ncbi:hypothetical protein FXO38_33535 [Capsicum annuum]|nr:hypothetical protein FXO38_33535 [Capsicum annuum]